MQASGTGTPMRYSYSNAVSIGALNVVVNQGSGSKGDSRVAKLESEVEFLQGQVNRLHVVINGHNKELEAIVNSYLKATEQLAAMKDDPAAKKKYNAYLYTANALEGENVSLKKELSESQAKVMDLMGTEKTLTREIVDLIKKVDGLKATISKFEQEKQSLMNKADEAKKQLEAQARASQAHLELLSELQKQLSAAKQSEVDALKARPDLTLEVADLKARVVEENSIAEKAEKRANQFEGESKELAKRVEVLSEKSTQALAQKQQEVGRVTARADKFEAVAQTLTKYAGKLSKDNADLQKTNDELKRADDDKAYDNMWDVFQIEELQEEKAKQAEEIAKLKEQLQVERTRRRAAESELKASKHKHHKKNPLV
jgi:chromosome segregation ATPase